MPSALETLEKLRLYLWVRLKKTLNTIAYPVLLIIVTVICIVGGKTGDVVCWEGDGQGYLPVDLNVFLMPARLQVSR